MDPTLTESADSSSMSEDQAVEALMETLGGDGEDGPDVDTSEDLQAADNEDGSDIPDDDDDDSLEGAEDDDSSEGAEEDDAEGAELPDVSDETVLQIEVDGETRDFTVGTLKNIAAQSERITEQGRAVEALGQQAGVALEAALQMAGEDFAPYANVDWLVLQNQLSPEEFTWHRENASRALKRQQAIAQQVETFKERNAAARERKMAVEAAEAVRILSDPQTGIEGWSDELYGQILDYGTKQGLDAEDLASVTNPTVLKLLHKARLYDKGVTASAKKIKQAPTRTLRSARGQEDRTGTPNKAALAKKAANRFAQTQSEDDAIRLLALSM